jgi:4-amino-4-deoxy-L-arabinose transferase-like glycosyltransferase
MMASVLRDRRTVWIIAVISFLLFVVGNLPWQLDDYDQAKQAFTSFEMVKEGHWFYQRTPHEHVATKPPLVAWISAGLFSVTRSWELAWRLPSLLAAIALLVLLFRAANCAYGPIAGLVALSAFGLNLLSPRLATLVRTDMPLALVIFLMGLLIWQKTRRQEEWKFRDRVYLFVLLTISMLIKGPIVYAFLLPGIALFQWRYGRSQSPGVPCCSAWPGWWPWIVSLAVFLLWVIGGAWFQPGFFNEVVIREFLGRFGETVHRPQPLYFYLPHLLHKFAPWSVLLVLFCGISLAEHRWRVPTALREMSPETFWLLCWSVGGLIVMSLIPSKRVDRIFPIIPPLCLLLAAQAPDRVGVLRQAYLVVAVVFAIFFSAGYATWKTVTGYRDHRDALAIFGRDVCNEAKAHRLRYEVVSSKDEGLLLYLQKMHYIKPDRAVAEWKAGNLDALVASSEKASTLMPRLPGATVSQIKSGDKEKEEGTDYVLIVH